MTDRYVCPEAFFFDREQVLLKGGPLSTFGDGQGMSGPVSSSGAGYETQDV